MNHKTLAIILIVLLGGMALYYNKSVSQNLNTPSDSAPKVETAK